MACHVISARPESFVSTTEDEMAPKQDRRRRPSSKTANKSKSTNDSVTSESSGKIFEGINFILTQSQHQPTDNAEVMSTFEEETEDDEMVSESESPVDPDAVKPLVMNKKELKKLIAENGGIYLGEFPGPKQIIPDSVILISDRYCLTMKYLTAIVHGFQLVNFAWIINCVRARSKLPLQSYFLPLGYSSLEKKEIESTDIGNLRHLLEKSHILIASNHKSFTADWKPVLARMGALVHSRSQGGLDRSLPALNLIIADTEAPPNIVKDAIWKNIPVVTPLWLIQSIINGKRLPTEKFII